MKIPKISMRGRRGRWLMSRTARSKACRPSRAFALVQRCETRNTPTGNTPESEWSLRSQNPRRDAATSGDRELGTAPPGVIREPSDPVKQTVLTELCGDVGTPVCSFCVRWAIRVGSGTDGGARAEPRGAGILSSVDATVRQLRSNRSRGARAEPPEVP